MQRELVAENFRLYSLTTEQLPFSKRGMIPGIVSCLGKNCDRGGQTLARRTGQAGEGTWKPLAVSHDEVLAKSGFTKQETEVTFEKA